MNAPDRIVTSLRNAPSAPLTREELDRMREKAWHEKGLICLYPDECTNDFVRQGAVNDMARKFPGKAKR